MVNRKLRSASVHLLFPLALALGLGCAVSPEDPVGVEEDLFPLDLGYLWTYSLVDLNGRQTGEPWTFSVTQSSQSRNTVIYYRYSSRYTPYSPLQEAYYKDDTGVYLLAMTGDIIERRIAYPLEMDRDWEFTAPRVVKDSSGQEQATYLRLARAVTRERITLSNGMKFESALKIVYTFQGATRSTVIQRWFAPGVGLVREITSQNQTIELQKYQLASENPAR